MVMLANGEIVNARVINGLDELHQASVKLAQPLVFEKTIVA